MVKVFIIFVRYHQKIHKPGDTCPSLNLILPMIDGTAHLQPFLRNRLVLQACYEMLSHNPHLFDPGTHTCKSVGAADCSEGSSYRSMVSPHQQNLFFKVPMSAMDHYTDLHSQPIVTSFLFSTIQLP